MAKHPRVLCPSCERPVAGIPTRGIGILSLHDHKKEPRALVLCPGSMQHVQAKDAVSVQEVFFEEPPEAPEAPATIF